MIEINFQLCTVIYLCRLEKKREDGYIKSYSQKLSIIFWMSNVNEFLYIEDIFNISNMHFMHEDVFW